MNHNSVDHKRIAVVGGGIAGLAAAVRAKQLLPASKLTLFEASSRLGGTLRTSTRDGYLIEHAADSFLYSPQMPWARRLCDAVGFQEEQLLPTSQQYRGAQVFWNGRLHPVPDGFQLLAPSRMRSVLLSSLLSWPGKLRLCCEPFIPRNAHASDESLSQFAIKRVGVEAADRLVEPLVAGIYTADPHKLSIQAALPQLVELVQKHGSLYRGFRRRRSDAKDRGARYSLFSAPQAGFESLLLAIEQSLTDTQPTVEIRRNTRIHALTPTESGWQVRWQHPISQPATEPVDTAPFDAVIVAIPAYHAASVLRNECTQSIDDSVAENNIDKLANTLREIPYANSAVVCMGVDQRDVPTSSWSFGCVVPRSIGIRTLAISFASLKFPDRAPPGKLLLRVFLGGALWPECTQQTDEQLIALALSDAARVIGLSSEPDFVKVFRWHQAMPQYELGHLDRVAQMRAELQQHPTLALAGNAFQGVGIPQCVRSGYQAAEQIAATIDQSSRDPNHYH